MPDNNDDVFAPNDRYYDAEGYAISIGHERYGPISPLRAAFLTLAHQPEQSSKGMVARVEHFLAGQIDLDDDRPLAAGLLMLGDLRALLTLARQSSETVSDEEVREMCERLRAMQDSPEHVRVGISLKVPINPDGPAAAALIERLKG